MSEGIHIVHPSNPLPGVLATYLPAGMMETLGQIETEKKFEVYVVRGVVADHISLEFEISEFLSRPSEALIRLSENPITLNLHYGGTKAFFFDLVADGSGSLRHIEVEIEADHPNATFPPARTLINQLLDTLMRDIWMPLSIVRLDVSRHGTDRPLLQQAIYPFNRILNFSPLGGFHTSYLFSPYEALLRETITATSPYYRVMCAYRLLEGIKFLRYELRKLAEKIEGELPALPKVPKVESEILENFGFRFEPSTEIKSLDSLITATKTLRDSVGHFQAKSQGEAALHLSSGESYRLFSAIGAVLLQYAHTAFRDLLVYFNQNLSSHVFRGSILPLPENREMFRTKADSYYSPQEPKS
jgi:hypothetical protein